MFGIGLPEIIVIAAVALVFIGPDKLPGVLRSLGKGLVELKRATSDVRTTVQDEMHKIEEEIEIQNLVFKPTRMPAGMVDPLDPENNSFMNKNVEEARKKLCDRSENM